MYHCLAWTADLVTATLTDLTVVADEIFTVANGHFLMPEDLSLYGAIAYGTNLQRVRIDTPKTRQINQPFIRPHQPTLIGGNDSNVWMADRNPIALRGQEELRLDAIHNAGVNQRITVAGFLGRRLEPIPAGDVYVIRATSTTAATANVWSLLTYTLDQNLPAGRYAVINVEHISTNGQAVRAVFDQQFYRPGAPSLVADGNRLPYPWLRYAMGVWGYFFTFSLPRIQVLCNGADATHTLYLHVVPVPGFSG